METADPPPARTRGRPSRAQSEAILDRLIEVAGHVFIEEGYGKTSVATIAERAGITKRTFYRHFADKRAVFEAVVRRSMADYSPLFVAGLEHRPVDEALLELGRQQIAKWREPISEFVRLVYAEAPRFPELGAVLDEATAETERQVAAILARVAGPGVDAAAAARKFLQMIHMGPQTWLLLSPRQPYPEALRAADLEIAVMLFAGSWQRVFAV